MPLILYKWRVVDRLTTVCSCPGRDKSPRWERKWHFATNHCKSQHQNTQIENKKSPPWGDSWLRSQSFFRSLCLCQYLYHCVRYLSSSVEIFCVRYLLHMSILISVSVLYDLCVYICPGGAALASIRVLKMYCYCI